MSLVLNSGFTLGPGVTVTDGIQPVKDGLIAYLDAGVTASYSGIGTVWHDLSGQGADATLNGTVTFVDKGASSYFTFNGDSANRITSILSQNYQDCTLVFYPDFTYNVSNANLAYGLGADYDRTMRFGNANGSSPWNIQNPGNNGDWAYQTATNYYLNGTTITGAGNLVNGWNILGAARTNQWGNFAYTWGTGYFDRGFKGKLAAILLYNRVLSAEEQQQNYQYFTTRKQYTQDPPPPILKSLSFNGTQGTQLDVLGNTGDWALGQHGTIEWWQKGIDSVSNGGTWAGGIISQGNGAGQNNGIDIFQVNGLSIGLGGNTSAWPEPTAGVWSHIAVTITPSGGGGQAHLYINGVEQTHLQGYTDTNCINGADILHIGCRIPDVGYQNWTGLITNLHISTATLYTGTFTPTIRTAPTTGTVLLLDSTNPLVDLGPHSHATTGTTVVVVDGPTI
jgi:hypothetical protein